ncbi:MAG: hypothetical protein H7836_11270 [Magnetococcus sp. YQC-3]
MPKPTPYPYLEVLKIIAGYSGIKNDKILSTAHATPALKAGSELKDNQQISKIVCDLRNAGRIATTDDPTDGKMHFITEKGLKLLRDSGESVASHTKEITQPEAIEPNFSTITATQIEDVINHKTPSLVEANFYDQLHADIENYITTQLMHAKLKEYLIDNKTTKIETLARLAELHNTDIAAVLTDIIQDLEAV